jgi:multiple sugar transport system substrate-binding protein
LSTTRVTPAHGSAFATFGDGSTCCFRASKNPEAAWKWISWLSTGPNNVLYNKAAGQMTVTTSGAANWTLHPKRFVDATVQSLPIAGVLPNLPQTADFTRVVGRRLRRRLCWDDPAR